MKDILQAAGFSTTLASSGEEAIDISKGCTFDLVIMDVNMGGMDGIDAFTIMKQETPAMKLLFVTGGEHGPRMNRAILDGAIGTMVKPVDVDRLLRVARGANYQRP